MYRNILSGFYDFLVRHEKYFGGCGVKKIEANRSSEKGNGKKFGWGSVQNYEWVNFFSTIFCS